MATEQGFDETNAGVVDTEEIAQRTRLTEILERRTEVLDARDAAREGLEYGEFGYESAIALYSGKLSGLILDIWPMFANATDDQGNDIGREYRERKEIDRVSVEPPEQLRQSLSPAADRVQPQQVLIEGLEWFVANGIAVSARFEGYRAGSVQPTTETASQIVPWTTVDRGMMVCEEFLAQVDVDVEFDSGPEVAEGRYEDVEQWVEQNIDGGET